MSPASIPRRVFLKHSALGMLALRARNAIHPAADSIPARNLPFLARAFALTSLYEAPNGSLRTDRLGMVLGIAPDSVHEVSALIDGWAAIEHGFVPFHALQPIAPYRLPPIWKHAAAPFWAEVITPSTIVQAWCDLRAPIRSSMGYGAVVNVLGTLIDDYKVTWYEIAAGWVDARHMQPIDHDFRRDFSGRADLSTEAATMWIDRARRTLRLTRNGLTVLHTGYAGGAALDRLAFSHDPVGTLKVDQPGDANGLPWLMTLRSNRESRLQSLAGSLRVRGAWDHNRFGLIGSVPIGDRLTAADGDLTIAPEAAKILYIYLYDLGETSRGCVVRIAP